MKRKIKKESAKQCSECTGTGMRLNEYNAERCFKCEGYGSLPSKQKSLRVKKTAKSIHVNGTCKGA